MVHILTTDTIYTLNVKPKKEYCDEMYGAIGIVCIDTNTNTATISSPEYYYDVVSKLVNICVEIEDKINGEVL